MPIVALTLALAAQMSAPVEAPNGGVVTILQGRCLPRSLTGTGAADSDLTRGGQPFRCDKATFAFWIATNRVLIEFVNKQSRAGLVGFAGQVSTEDREVKVDHLYLNDGQTLQADDGGFCTIHGARSKISSINCAGKVTQGSIAFGAMIFFETGKAPIKRRR